MSRQSPGGARDRILEAAYELFSRHGIRAVGIDAIIARSRVARMTLYRLGALLLAHERERAGAPSQAA